MNDAPHITKPTQHRRLWLCASLLLLSANFLFGCAKITRSTQSREMPRVIWEVEFKGNKKLANSDILAAIENVPTSGSVKLTRLRPFGNFSVIKSDRILRSDVRRIKQLYRYHGYYNTTLSYRFQEVTLARQNRYRKYRRVKLILTITEGKQIKVRKLDIKLIPHNHPRATQIRKALKEIALKVDGGFSTPSYRLMKGQIQKRLQDLSYALVAVKSRAVIDKVVNKADVKITIRPGPVCSFGNISIQGNKRVSSYLLRQLFKFKKGERYKVQSLVDTQRVLSALGLFTTVDFKPQLDVVRKAKSGPCYIPKKAARVAFLQKQSQGKRGLCPVDIRLDLFEDQFQLLKLGLGAVIDGQRQQIEANIGWEILNFLGGLRRLELNIRPGLAFLPDIIRRFDYGPDITGTLSFKQPIFWKRQAEFGARVLYRYVAQVGDSDYQTLTPSVWLSIPILQKLSVRLSWNVELAFGVQDPVLLERENYVLDYFEQQLVLDLRDDPLKTRSGIFFSLTLQESFLFGLIGDPVNGKFRFIKVSPELRFFIPLPFAKAVLAGRIQYGAILFPNRRSSQAEMDRISQLKGSADPIYRAEGRILELSRRSPFTQRFFAGGANSVRGWTARYLGPLRCSVRYQRYNQQASSQAGNTGNTTQPAIRFVRNQESTARSLYGTGGVRSGDVCNPEAARVARNRFGDMANQRNGLPLGGFSGSLPLPRQEILQIIPAGGEQMFVASLELRIPISSLLGVVIFSDAGVVQAEPNFSVPDIVPSISVGGGLRLYTLIGAIRFDVAFRLPSSWFPDPNVPANGTRYPLQPVWLFHFSIGEAF